MTSQGTPSTVALTVPNRAPTSTTLRPMGRSSASISSGRALVAKSFSGVVRSLPTSASRTDPPTR